MKKPFDCKVASFALHYEAHIEGTDQEYKALSVFVESAQQLKVGDEYVFRSVSDNGGVIDFEFMSERSVKDLRHWSDWLEMAFMSILEAAKCN